MPSDSLTVWARTLQPRRPLSVRYPLILSGALRGCTLPPHPQGMRGSLRDEGVPERMRGYRTFSQRSLRGCSVWPFRAKRKCPCQRIQCGLLWHLHSGVPPGGLQSQCVFGLQEPKLSQARDSATETPLPRSHLRRRKHECSPGKKGGPGCNLLTSLNCRSPSSPRHETVAGIPGIPF